MRRGGWLLPARGTSALHKGLGCLAHLSATHSLKRGKRSKVPSDICVNYLMLLRSLHAVLLVLRSSTLLLCFLELRSSLVFISSV